MAGDDRAAMIEDIEIDLFLLGLERAYGMDCGSSAGGAVRTAVLEQVRARRSRNVTALLERVLHDVQCGQEVAASLATDKLEFFADAAFFRALRSHAVPRLRTCPFINVWMSEPLSSADVYSVAIVLFEAGIHPRSRIYATYRDGQRLAWTSTGAVSERALEFSASQYRLAGGAHTLREYFDEREHQLTPAHWLRRNILWAQYDLCNGAPFHEFNLIICRDDGMHQLPVQDKKRVHALLGGSLALSGLLALPPDRPLDAVFASRYRLLDAESGLYQRVR